VKATQFVIAREIEATLPDAAELRDEGLLVGESSGVDAVRHIYLDTSGGRIAPNRGPMLSLAP